MSPVDKCRSSTSTSYTAKNGDEEMKMLVFAFMSIYKEHI